MSLLNENSAVLAKTKELCSSILEDPSYLSLQQQVEAFFGNPEAKLQFQKVNEQGEALHHKQSSGLELSAQEIKEFETSRAALFENKIAVDFMNAQRELEGLQDVVSRYVSMTLMNNEVPSDDEVAEAASSSGGCCGGGSCGC